MIYYRIFISEHCAGLCIQYCLGQLVPREGTNKLASRVESLEEMGDWSFLASKVVASTFQQMRLWALLRVGNRKVIGIFNVKVT
jgi:hypothetical protein